MVANFTAHTLRLNREQALHQLELLGYERGDKIFMRYIHPNPAEGQPKSIKKSRLNWEECDRYQSQGYDAYFVVNGGGDTDAAIKAGRAIFYEHDNLPKGIQQDLWRNLGLPEPTFQVDTGGKSIHSYWVFHQPIGIKDWCELQEDLLKFADGDRSIKNPSRILRLAGCRYMKGDNPGSNIATIITASGKRYSYLELRNVIQAQKSQASPLDSIELPVSESVPLEVCLTKRSREMLASGTTAPDKQRNDSGIELARDLIGTVAYLEKIGQAYDGNPEILFFDWCRAVALDTDKPKGQPEGIWKSASKDNPSPGSGEDGVQACIKGWHWNTNLKPSGKGFGSRRVRSGGGNSGGGDGGDRGDGGGNVIDFPGGSSSPLEFVKQILAENKTKAEQNSAFAASKWNPRDLWAIARELEREEDTSEESQEAIESLPRLLHKQKLDPFDYLWGDGGQLAQAIVTTAEAMPTSPSFLMTTLLPVAATLIGTSSRIVVKPSGKYKQPCIFQSGVVARSGKIKTPAQNIIVDPLVRLEIEAFKEYEKELENYRIEHARWKKEKGDPEDEPQAPIRKRYTTKDATLESLERIHGQNPRGILVYRDELAGDFKAENAHRSGKGADKEAKLDQFNGGAIIVDRKEREVILERSAVSRTGSIQWDVLQGLMGDHDDSAGVFARWIFDCAESAPRFINFDDAPDTGIDQLLTDLYKRLALMPDADYLLSPEAKPIFREWQHYLVNRELRESGGLQLVYPKIEAYTTRFALWLHVVNAALAGQTPSPTIDGQTMARAVKMAEYYLSQWEFLTAINSPQSGLTGTLLKIYEYIKGKPEGVTLRKLKASIRALRNVDKSEIQSHLQWLVDKGHVTLDGKNFKSVDTADKKLTPVSTSETPINNGVQKNVDIVDKLTPHASPLDTPPSNVGFAHIESVNNVNASTVNPKTTAQQGVDTADKLVDAQSVGVSTVNITPTRTSCENAPEAQTIPQERCEVVSVGVTDLGNNLGNPSPTIPQVPKVCDSSAQTVTVEAPPAELAQATTMAGEEVSQTDPMESEGVIADLTQMLELCDSIEFLAALRQTEGFTPSLLNKACKQLSPEKHGQIRQWAIELNQAPKAGDRVFVNSWPHTDKLGPYLVERIEGGRAKLEMFDNLVLLSDLRLAD